MIPLKPRRLAALFNLFCLAWPLSASALQIVDVSDGVTAYAKIASDELTRISIADGRIASWYVPKGKLVIEKDAKGGQLYVRPLDRSAVVSMFITSGSGATYALTMQPVAMPSESVVLREAWAAQEPGIHRTGRFPRERHQGADAHDGLGPDPA